MRFTGLATASILLVALQFSAGPAAVAAEPPAATAAIADVPLVDARIRLLMQDRKYGEARQVVDAAAKVNHAAGDYLAYLKGWSFYLEKQYDAALAAYAECEKQYPQSPWLRRVRFARALAMARKGDSKAAEEIFRSEAEYLLSADRVQELAGIYLEFADASFQPPKPQLPDYAKALKFYLKALEMGPKPDERAKVELLVGRCYEQIGDRGEAAKAYTQFLAAHPQHALEIEARYRLGACRLADGDRREARRVWQDLLAKYPAANSPWVVEAAFHLAETWRVPTPQNREELSLGVAALTAFIERFPTDKLASLAHLQIAKSYICRGRHEDAVACLNRFIKDPRYQDRREIPDAYDLLGQTYQLQKKFTEALAVWREFLVKFPTQQAWSAVQQEIIDTEYLMGLEQYKAKDYAAAARLLGEFLVKYPLDARDPGILFLFGQMNHQQKRWDAAIADWRRLTSKYPRTEAAAQAQFMIAQTTEQELGKLEAALEEYRKVASGRHADDARQAVARLTSKNMTVATERTFRSNETPRLSLTTRNLEAVTVRLYSVDLETYFRKMHTTEGIEGLNIALIDPDATFEFRVPGYAKYQQIRSSVDVPLPAKATAGVMAVTVSSATLEATTLVIQSDLEIIVKTSRDETFVFAENMRTGKPWPGVRLLLSNGQQVFAEEKTGPAGVFAKSYEQLQAAGDVRVFAAADGQVAANTVSLQDVRPAHGLADKGYLYTDRPAYQAGQTVHVRGCVRQVSGDAYTIEPGAAYTLEVFDGRNRLVWQGRAELSPQGTFQAAFDLPATSPQGPYRILARDDADHSYQGAFQVHRFQQQTIRLVIDTPPRVYYRGDFIEGTIRATYYYGAPLVGREIRYQLAKEPIVVAKTDVRGEVHFKLPTREFSETQLLPLVATLGEQNLQVSRQFALAAEGFAIQLSTVRPVFVAGETFELRAAARDAENQPVARKMTLKVLELLPVQGKIGERLVEEHPLATAADGTARYTLKLAKGGAYLLRAEATDRFENVISGQTEVRISDDADRQRVLILADRHTFKAGDTAQVQLHWREAPALALLTFQGARILDYKLIELKTGANPLAIPMTAKLAPNFELAVAVMTDTRAAAAGEPAVRFHQASSPFTVERELQVKLACKAQGSGAIRPGAAVEVAVTTSDPQGKPVAAEVSLTLVQQSLLDRFAWPAGPIEAFFHGTFRQPSICTDASIRFACHPATQPISPRLLAERQRQEIAAEEDASRAEGLSAGTGRGSRPTAAEAIGPPSSTKQADFDSLVELITSTVKPDTWENVGGPGAVGGFSTNLSLKVAQKPQGSFAAFGAMTASKGEPQAEGLSSAPSASSVALRPLLPVAEPGYWNPAIATGADGKATVTFTLPEQSTAWKLLAKGITAETLVGETAEPLTVKKDLFGELKLPAALTDGDVAEIVAVVHNDVVDKDPIAVTLKTTIGGQSVEDRQEIAAAGKGPHELTFRRTIQAAAAPAAEGPPSMSAAAALFELTVAAGPHRDVARRSVPLVPYGMSVVATASGEATGDTAAWVEPPTNMPVESPSLQIVIGPTVEQSLLDILTGPAWGGPCQIEADPVASEAESAASDLLAALALQKLFGSSREAGGPQAQALDARIRAALGLLVLAQHEDGGWGWTGSGKSNRSTSARVVWAVALARQAGYRVADDAFHKALDYLREQAAATENTDYLGKAIMLHVLAVAGDGDFALANHLHRARSALSPTALAYLALALAQMDRKPMAAEVLELLDKRLGPDGARRDPPPAATGHDESAVEVRALWALALQRASPKSPRLRPLVDWLMAHRRGYRWAPDRDTGPAALALGAWFGENRFQGERYKLLVRVNGRQVDVLDVNPAAGARVVAVPAAALVKGKQRIEIQLTGRGRYTYQCLLAGFVPADRLKGTSPNWEVERTYQPALRELDGRAIPRGFGIVAGKVNRFRNPMTQLPVGRRGLVELNIRRTGAAPDAPAAPHEYLVVSEPIPSGAAVIASSLHGNYDRAEIVPGAIMFYIGSDRPLGPISYELDGYLAGAYRAGPTTVRDAYRPEQMAVARPASLTVLPLGAVSRDPYRLSPEELFELGRRLKEKGDLKPAAAHLAELVEQWNLQAEVYKQAIVMLLDIYIAEGPPAKIVQYFEILKEKWPDEDFSFDKAAKVAAAYHALGEFERSCLAFREIVENRFTRESGVAGFLEAQGEFLRSVEVMGRLLRDYPPEPYTAEAEFALAQRVYAKAAEASADAKLRQQHVNRVVLIRRAWEMLESLMTAYPEDPAADQAAFTAANALLELKDYKEAAAAAARYAARYPKSELLDSYWYLIAYCDFATGQHQAAIEMCRKVADAKRVDPKTGRTVESANKWRAIYILGQVYDSLGQLGDAIREYRRIEDRFPDAAAAIAWFQHKAIALPEVTTLRPGAAAAVELKFRNLAACDLKVYRIDLMKFSLLAGNLGGITQINLAGIRPLHEATEKLGSGTDYHDHTCQLALPLAKEGAYLVVCRGEDLHASGLVLVTPLEVEVQADPSSGQVRAMVKDTTTGRCATGVEVKVIGSQNADFVSGTTDLRGVFVADGIQGAPTVIAQGAAGRCAIFRSPRLPGDVPSAENLAGLPPSGQMPAGAAFDPRTATPALPPAEAAAPPTRYRRPVDVATAPVDMGGKGEVESTKRIQAALKSPTEMEFVETPLADVVDYVKDCHAIEVQIDKKALDDVGIGTDTPVTKSVKGVSLKSALQQILRPLNLTYIIQDEVLLITTPEEAENRLVTKIYPVADLVLPEGEPGTEAEADFDSLISMITATVRPSTWDDVGGPGTVQPFPNKLAIVLSQTQEVQEDVADLLASLRSVGKKTSDSATAAAPDEEAGIAAARKKFAEMQLKRRQSGEQGATAPRSHRGFAGGMGGGMGGMGGGFGGFGGFGAGGRQPRVISVIPTNGNADLLEGLQSTNRAIQGQKVQSLKKRQESGMGMGGVSGGGFF